MVTDAVTRLKQQAAYRAVEFVESGMVLGLGSGSTAVWALRRIAELYHAGTLRDLVGIPCSGWIEAEARERGIPLTTLNEHPVIDLTIDGADEVDPHLELIKGGGGALLHEKIVAQASRREIIVVDESKLVDRLGTHFALPVEVIEFGWQAQVAYLESLGASVVQRQKDDAAFRTDQGNLILDCRFGPIDDLQGLSRALEGRSGIVEHGLFLGLATDMIVASAEDDIRHVSRS